MKKFEYKTVRLNSDMKQDNINTDLNYLGADSWELISVIAYKTPHGVTNWHMCYFKRELEK